MQHYFPRLDNNGFFLDSEFVQFDRYSEEYNFPPDVINMELPEERVNNRCIIF